MEKTYISETRLYVYTSRTCCTIPPDVARGIFIECCPVTRRLIRRPAWHIRLRAPPHPTLSSRSHGKHDLPTPRLRLTIPLDSHMLICHSSHPATRLLGHTYKLLTRSPHNPFHSSQTSKRTMADIHTPIPKLKLNDGTSIPMVLNCPFKTYPVHSLTHL